MSLSFRHYLIVTFSLLLVESASFIIFRTPALVLPIFFSIVFVTAFLTWKKLEYGLSILVTELLIGGKGYLFSLEQGTIRLSIRISLFIVIVVVWFFRYRGKGNPILQIPLIQKRWLLGLATLIAWGVLLGLLKHRGLGPVYFDSNAFLFFLLTLVFFSSSIDRKKFFSTLIILIAAASTLLGLKSLISLGLFAHIDVGQLHSYYRWIRMTGVGEIAYINGNAYRVFFQSQIWGLFGALILSALLLPRAHPTRRDWWLLLPITLGVAAVLVSLSRSFWTGAVVSILIGVFAGPHFGQWKLRQYAATGLLSISILLIAYTLTSWALNFPYPFPPTRGTQAAKIIGQRFEAIGGEAAASSRINELAPLRTGILKNPIFGSGFGTPLTYTSNDPRQVQSPTHGVFTTYSFEWGYLDLILKVGLLGLIVYLGLLFTTVKKLWQINTPLSFGLLLAIISLVVIHITTPYLNHPLGIGLIMIALLVSTSEISKT